MAVQCLHAGYVQGYLRRCCAKLERQAVVAKLQTFGATLPVRELSLHACKHNPWKTHATKCLRWPGRAFTFPTHSKLFLIFDSSIAVLYCSMSLVGGSFARPQRDYNNKVLEGGMTVT